MAIFGMMTESYKLPKKIKQETITTSYSSLSLLLNIAISLLLNEEKLTWAIISFSHHYFYMYSIICSVETYQPPTGKVWGTSWRTFGRPLEF